jgi:kumamolisin
VLLDGVVENCGANCSGDGESANDIVQAISMAPGASAVIVYGGNSDVDIFNQMAADNIAKQTSVSYGWLPPDNTMDDPIFQEFAAQGQNLFAASDDSGAYDPSVNPTYYPADDPYITAAGGTQLTTKTAGDVKLLV